MSDVPTSKRSTEESSNVGSNGTELVDSTTPDGSNLEGSTEEPSGERSIRSKLVASPASDSSASNGSASARAAEDSPTDSSCASGKENQAQWECEKCTLLNDLSASKCSVCTTAKPRKKRRLR